MAQDHSDNRITAFDCEILRGAFRRSVVENRIAKREWRLHAEVLARELDREVDEVDPDILDWIIAK